MSDSVILVDAHVHVHSSADPARLLDSAAANFAEVAKELNAKRWQGALLLAEMADTDWFDSIARGAVGQVGRWSLQQSPGEDISICARHADRSLTIVAGRQIVTAEKIEVLALGTRITVPDGQELSTTLAAVGRSGAITVLPWGAGKWLGRRGRLVADALRKARELNVFPGDNSGRPAFWPEPAAFGFAVSRGYPVLPGTDPLPLPNEERRVGSVGFWTTGQLAVEAPAADLYSCLLGAHIKPVRRYGPRESMVGFFRNQLALRLKKH